MSTEHKSDTPDTDAIEDQWKHKCLGADQVMEHMRIMERNWHRCCRDYDRAQEQLKLITYDRDCWFQKDKTRYAQVEQLRAERDAMEQERDRLADKLAILAAEHDRWNSAFHKVAEERDAIAAKLAEAEEVIKLHDETDAAMSKQWDEAQRDSARLDWLEQHAIELSIADCKNGMRAAIDAAMTKEQP